MPHSPRGRLLPAAVGLACVCVALAGCTADRPPRAGTVSDPSPSVTETPERDEAPDFGRAGRRLTLRQARAALPGVGVLPSGWSVDPEDTMTGTDEDNEEETVRPARCQDVFDAAGAVAADPVVRAGRSFTAGMLGPFLGVEIRSYADPVPDDKLRNALEALERCPRFSVEDAAGDVVDFTASALSMPNFGQETAALRMSATSQELTFAIDVVSIRVGHNTVGVTQMTFADAGGVEPLESAARATMANLDR